MNNTRLSKLFLIRLTVFEPGHCVLVEQNALGRYQILWVIGKGGMSKVNLAHHE